MYRRFIKQSSIMEQCMEIYILSERKGANKDKHICECKIMLKLVCVPYWLNFCSVVVFRSLNYLLIQGLSCTNRAKGLVPIPQG